VNTTSNPDPSSDKPSRDNAESQSASGAPPGPADQPRKRVNIASGGKTDKPAAEPKKKDDLPEYEPLTPELVEDEALRGDFMLRWALVLLALLIGCTEIAETQTLVHVKSGQYTLENMLPARTGVLSATAEDRPWHNLSWLFDVALAGVYAAGGAIGLSIFKAIVAAAIFGFIVHTNRKDVSTWWGTICAGLALIVCHRQLTARPEIVTLLGLAVTLWLLHRWREERQTRFLKGLLVVFFLWSNMDPGMFYGLAALVLYAVGETAGNWLGYAGLDNDTHRKQLWMAVAGCAAVTLLNPFGWNALLAPVARYATEYPALQGYYPVGATSTFVQLQYYPIWQPEFWAALDAAAVAGLVLGAAALISFVLNFRRLDFGDFVVWLAFVALASIATHELAAAAVVSAVLATLNAQQWYQHTFRQSYSVETSELVFSRGGRAVTVLALFGLAYLSISGLWGRLQTRTGVGFDANLQAAIESFDAELADSFDDRPFNFVLWQGDVLVWIGEKPFIDSRLPLYAGTGKNDLIAVHRACREQLARSDRPGSAGREWKPTLDRFHITHVVPRMDSRIVKVDVNPQLFFALSRSPDWQLARYGATTAVFYRTDLDDRELLAYLGRNRTDFIKEAFRTSTNDPEIRFDWARGKSFTERWLSRPRNVTPNSIELARNYLALMGGAAATRQSGTSGSLATDPVSLAAGCSHLIIRNANAGLVRHPQNAEAFRMLGRAYTVLGDIEQRLAQQSAVALAKRMGRSGNQLNLTLGAIRRRRYRQAAAALQQALIIAPDDEPTLQLLAHVQFFLGRKLDLAVASCDRCIELMDRKADLSKRAQQTRDSFVRNREFAQRKINQIRENVEKAKSSLKEDDASRIARYRLAQYAAQFGCVQLAIDMIEEDRDMLDRDPNAAYFYADLLQQAGRAREAFENLEQLESRLEDRPRRISWRTLDAHAALTRADYAKAVRIWSLAVVELDNRRFEDLMGTLPLAMRGPSAAGRGLQLPGMWITDQTQALQSSLQDTPFSMAVLKLQVALAQMETGHPQRAAETFRDLVALAPESPLRGLGGFYLRLLTGEQLPPLSPAKPSAAPKPGARLPVEAPRSKPPSK
jgi:tetratricopeptide (TPR) repeat protein